jgi:hypothetical protein
VLQPAFAEWRRPKNRRSIPHRFEDCERWKIRGIRHTIFGKTSLTERDRLAAAIGFSGAR